jgi:outer membrane beta-barrel protein
MRGHHRTVLSRGTRRAPSAGVLLACVAASVVASFSGAGAAHAQEEDERAETRVVQRRKFRLGHELFLAAGWLPLDAFEKGVTGSAGYALHFTDQFALEVGLTKTLVYNTALRDELLALGEVEPESFRIVETYFSGAINWSPFYGKLAVKSGSLVHLDFSITAGGGYGWFPETNRPLLLWGLGLRLFLSESLSTRLDVRSLHFVEADSLLSGWDVHNELQMSLGIALSLGG